MGVIESSARFRRAEAQPSAAFALLCVPACEPRGSGYAGRAWSWMLQLASSPYPVVVVTRSNQRAKIEAELARAPVPNARFLYWDLPAACAWMRYTALGRRLQRALWFRAAQYALRAWSEQARLNEWHRVQHRSICSLAYFAPAGAPAPRIRLAAPAVTGPTSVHSRPAHPAGSAD